VDDHGRLHRHHHEPPTDTAIGGRSRAVALAVLCLCALTTAVDMTITNVALPFIGHDLDAPTNELQWVVDAYNIVLAGLLVLGGGLADRYGRRRVFLIGYTVFGVACACAAFSGTAELLIASRVLMGIGAAGVIAPALAIIASMYPPEQRAGAISAFVVFGAIGLAVGPIAGGLLLDHFWWGSVFLVNVPVVAVAVVVGARTIPESRAPVPEGVRPSLDVIGAVLSVVGLGALLFGVIEGPARGWTAPGVLAGLVGGAVVIALFVWRELHVRSPLFDVRILRRPVVLTGSITLFIAYVLFTGFLFVVPQYLQDVASESIVAVGLLLVPFAVVFGLCSTRAPAVLARFGARSTIAAGLVVSAIAAVLLAVAVGGAIVFTVAATAVLGAGLSMLIAPPSTVVMNDVPESKAGDGSSLNMVSRFVGAAVGVAIVGSVLASVYARELSPAVASLPPAQADEAQGSIQGAVEVAQTLPTTAGNALLGAARDAFDRGATVAYVVIAAMAVLAAAWAWVALRRVTAARVPVDEEHASRASSAAAP
jgi:MFS transporter, DHA2 family, multidrug resistance protein